ncbi:hypothetical protein [Aquamicrobium terrae]|uniref:Uncharacterized protein n=1 Tax=Aquamicrobium terrae TaxID=1324945 RepID=A0ABV2N2P4_9HYPH
MRSRRGGRCRRIGNGRVDKGRVDKGPGRDSDAGRQADVFLDFISTIG